MPDSRLERARASYLCPLCGESTVETPHVEHYVTEDNPFDWTQPRILCRDTRSGLPFYPRLEEMAPMSG